MICNSSGGRFAVPHRLRQDAKARSDACADITKFKKCLTGQIFSMSQNSEYILQVDGVSKRYGGVRALKSVRFDLKPGEVHALVGENGAGKSTLIKILGGAVHRDEGTVIYNGDDVRFKTPYEAQNAGIAVIHQELSMMPSMSVIENLFTGRMESRFGVINWRRLKKQAHKALEAVNLKVDVFTPVQDLTISQRQLIEIARVLSTNARLIIMDEPNSSLSASESQRLFDVIERLKAQDIPVIYVSHKLDEVLEISDRITVFRDGAYVNTIDTAEATEQKIINMMVGRELDRDQVNIPQTYSSENLLEVRNLTGKRFNDVSFDIRRGEILGLSGLVGAGRSDVARAIFGADKFSSGRIIFDGKPVRFSTPAQAIKAGIGMVQEDRKVLSLFMGLSIQHNMSMAQLPRMSATKTINYGRERGMVKQLVKTLDIRLASINNPVSSLSGGNQQKTVLARWLATEPKLLILDEPTHGVDVGAKAEIYELMRELARQGISILLISSELPEIMSLSHRIVVMSEGRITGIVDGPESTEEGLMEYATGIRDDFAISAAEEAGKL
ncbi:MAG: sugar ABC transporter ATP-binding protein [Anaerolineaceae bacterium]|nr:MAG: sugar ABC transporter ATP-binding protein [Anaerolineaceae bacterium]